MANFIELTDSKTGECVFINLDNICHAKVTKYEGQTEKMQITFVNSSPDRNEHSYDLPPEFVEEVIGYLRSLKSE